MNPILAKHWKKLVAVIAVIALCATSYAFGKAATPPAEVRIQERIVEVEKIVEKIVEVEKVVVVHDTKTRVKRVEVVKPDGTVIKTEDINHDTHTDSVKERVVEVEKVVEKLVEVEKLVKVSQPQPDWRIAPLVGVNIPQALTIVDGFDPLKQLSFGAHVERRILGPASLGVWGLHTGQVGVSVSLEF